ncbi:cyclic nucleotide-binding domain-containing protein [Heliobacterium gestii]|uniref:Cyclic nucleotide-binding domain-containing protein n=1 Tax=Heliomicrobium gestii TaxID=2699 RepID=A0A845L649_HELGE|nr:methyl-accepting chemotaxis protein [Heliomicrobium gestii]MBM7865422.1 CRP-like cAMP-binding protein [Heliomicrobium gestii]MZP41678.1 cyclic nucleotide-binding domain-containing protein [Heliomicrobium gestii]
MEWKALEKYGSTKTLQVGELLFREGEEGKEMFLLLQGAIEVYVERNEKKITLAVLREGTTFGEMTLLERMPRSANAKAIEYTKLLVLDEPSFRDVIREQGDFSWMLMKELSSRIRSNNLDVIQRIGQDLQDAAHQLGEYAHQITGMVTRVVESSKEIETNQSLLFQDIQEVSKLAEKISKSFDFVRTIANQTKILGINASIESARSGEQGKGFAVVAREVRQLSELSKNNAEETRKLLTDIEGRVKNISHSSEKSSTQCQKQTTENQQIEALIEEVLKLSERLVQIATTL